MRSIASQSCIHTRVLWGVVQWYCAGACTHMHLCRSQHISYADLLHGAKLSCGKQQVWTCAISTQQCRWPHWYTHLGSLNGTTLLLRHYHIGILPTTIVLYIRQHAEQCVSLQCVTLLHNTLPQCVRRTVYAYLDVLHSLGVQLDSRWLQCWLH
jgi:hypothetical protein